MGFVIADMRVLETAFGFNLFIMSLDMGWRGGIADPLTRNFDQLARRIEGHGAALVRCLDELPREAICHTYLGSALYELSSLLPALLITDARPDEVVDSTMRLVVPLKKVEKLYGSFDEFLTELVKFARDRDSAFLERFEDRSLDFWDALNLLELKPNMFGFGINLTGMIDLLRQSRAD